MRRSLLWMVAAGQLAMAACRGPVAPGDRATGGLALGIVARGTTSEDSGIVHVVGQTNKIVKVAAGTTDTISGLIPGAYTVALEGYKGNGIDNFGQTTGIQVVAGRDTQATVTLAPFQATLEAIDTLTLGRRVYMSWSGVSNAASYRLEWSQDPSFGTGVGDTTWSGPNTNLLVDLPAYGGYYVRVRAVDSYGDSGQSSTAYFTDARQTMYVADSGAHNSWIFLGPFTSFSAPAYMLADGSAGPVGIAVDTGGTLAVCDNLKNVNIYTIVPFGTVVTDATLAFNACSLMAFDASGALYVPNQGRKVYVFTPPITNSSTPGTITSDLTGVESVAFDSTILFVGGGSCPPCQVNAYAPPYTSAPLFSVGHGRLRSIAGIAIDSLHNLYVADVNANKVVVYNAPLSSIPDSAFSIATGVSSPEGIAFDRNGSLYVVNGGNSTITIYTSPLRATSAPAVTITSGLVGPFGVALDR